MTLTASWPIITCMEWLLAVVVALVLCHWLERLLERPWFALPCLALGACAGLWWMWTHHRWLLIGLASYGVLAVAAVSWWEHRKRRRQADLQA